MASVTGSRLAFFSSTVSADKVNVVLTADGSDVAGKSIAGDFNIEVFTVTAGSLASGFDGSAFVQGAQQLTNNAVQAGSVTSTEQVLAGSYTLIDLSGGSKQGESIQIIGSSGATDVVVGSANDTITGSTNAATQQFIDASGLNTDANPGPFRGPETVFGGAGGTTVGGGQGDVITGGSGFLQVNETTVASISPGFAGQETVKGGSGSLSVFQIGPQFSITGSTGGTTFVDDTYSVSGNAIGGNSSIVGGNGSGVISVAGISTGANTIIFAQKGDHVTVGSALTAVDASRGNITVTGGSGSATGSVVGTPINVNTAILTGTGDVLNLGGAATYVEALFAGANTVNAGNGFVHADAGIGTSIVGSSGNLEVNAPLGSTTVTAGTGNLFIFNMGKNEVVTGGSGTNFINDGYGGGGNSSITGGSGTVTGAGGQAVNTLIVGAAGDSIGGGSGSTSINAIAGSEAITVGAGATTVQAGSKDTVTANAGTGTLLVDLDSDQSTTTINLGGGHGAATLRDVSVTGGSTAQDSVTGFSTATDVIASKTSVNSSGTFLGTSASDGKGGTILTFLDGVQMTLAGVADPTKIKFTQ